MLHKQAQAICIRVLSVKVELFNFDPLMVKNTTSSIRFASILHVFAQNIGIRLGVEVNTSGKLVISSFTNNSQSSQFFQEQYQVEVFAKVRLLPIY